MAALTPLTLLQDVRQTVFEAGTWLCMKRRSSALPDDVIRHDTMGLLNDNVLHERDLDEMNMSPTINEATYGNLVIFKVAERWTQGGWIKVTAGFLDFHEGPTDREFDESENGWLLEEGVVQLARGMRNSGNFTAEPVTFNIGSGARVMSIDHVLRNMGVLPTLPTLPAPEPAVVEEWPTTFPEDFMCSITQSMMKDPVMLISGISYERTAIQRWFDIGKRSCPNTRQHLRSAADRRLIPNVGLKNLIEEFVTKWRADSDEL